MEFQVLKAVITLLVVVVIVGILACVDHRKKEEQRLAAEVALQAEIDACAAPNAKVQAGVSNILKTIAVAQAQAEDALAIARREAPQVQPKAAASPRVVDQPATPAPRTPVPSPAAATPSAPSDSAAPFGEPTREELDRRRQAAGQRPAGEEKPAAAATPADQTVPFGEPTREELDRRRAAREAGRESPAEKPAATPSSAPADNPAYAQRPGLRKKEEPPQLSLVARLAAIVSEKSDDLAACSNEALVVADTARSLCQSVMDSALADEAAVKNKDLAAQVTVVQDLDTRVRDLAATLSKACQDVRAEEARLNAERAQREAEAQKRRQEEERQQLIGRELGQVDAERQRVASIAEKHGYTEITNSLSSFLPSYKTDEGRAALSLLIERYTRLAGLKTFIVQRINAAPYRWGWVESASPKDILKADEAQLLVTGGSVPWTEVPPRQMMKLIHYALSDKQLSIRAIGEQSLAAAIYCADRGYVDASKEFSAKAVENCRDLAEKSQKLLAP